MTEQTEWSELTKRMVASEELIRRGKKNYNEKEEIKKNDSSLHVEQNVVANKCIQNST